MRLKQYLREELLLEKTFAVSKDVNYIYKTCFKTLIDEIWIHAGSGKHLNFTSPARDRLLNKSSHKDIWKKVANGLDVTYKQIMSEDLPGKQAKEASKVNPTVITCGIYKEGNLYRPKEEYIAAGIKGPGGKTWDRGVIILSINNSALKTALNNGMEYIQPSQLKSFTSEFKEARIKSTIAHELSHWLNDTMHNFHITKLIGTTRELAKPEILLLHKKDVNMTHFEIDAQIHGIKQLKMAHRKDWDKMTLADVFMEYNALRFMGGNIYQKYGKEIGDIWQKAVIKRMAREKLLGKNMKKFAKYPEDFKG
jgi:hypothetical protein